MSDTKNKRAQIQIDNDRRDIASFYLQGYTQAQIAEVINSDPDRGYTLTQQMISYDLARIREAWLESSLLDFNEVKGRELARIDKVEREAWTAWERSQDDAETTKVVETESNKRWEAQTKGQAGDPRFLDIVMKCVDRRCKILGVDAPAKLHTMDIDLGTLTEEQLRRVASGEDPAHIMATSGEGRTGEAEASGE